MDASLAKVKSKSKHWEREAKVGGERIAQMEKERNEAKQEAKVARLAASTVGDTRARAEKDLARVQEVLAAIEGHKVEAENARLEVERTSFLLELKETKDEVSSLHSQARKDKEAMEDEYQKALEVIFAYGYGCCVFKHNICGDHPEVLEGMVDFANPLSPEFFVNPSCPPV